MVLGRYKLACVFCDCIRNLSRCMDYCTNKKQITDEDLLRYYKKETGNAQWNKA